MVQARELCALLRQPVQARTAFVRRRRSRGGMAEIGDHHVVLRMLDVALQPYFLYDLLKLYFAVPRIPSK